MNREALAHGSRNERTHERRERYADERRIGARDWRIIFKSVPLRFHCLGYALFALAANSLTMWGPAFFTRVHGMDIKTIGFVSGTLAIAGGVPGTIFGGYVADRFRKRGRGGRMLFTACGALAAIPLWLILLFSDSPVLLIFAVLLMYAASLMWLGPAAAVRA